VLEGFMPGIWVSVDGETGDSRLGFDLTSDWEIVYRFGRNDAGTTVVAGIEVRSFRRDAVPGDGVTLALINRIEMKPARRYISANWPIPAAPKRKPAAKRRVGAPGSVNYRQVLTKYKALCAARDPDPYRALAKTLGREYATVRSQVSRAKRIYGL
jgi:hypothetical protein